MFVEQYNEINHSLKQTDQAIIALGCSFVQGQGAIDDKLLELYDWKVDNSGTMSVDGNNDIKKKISNIYSIPINENFELNFTNMEYKNSFVNVLCEKYLNNTWTPINLGVRGNGNRSAIKQLYSNPHINIENISKKIVLYVPSGIERFDLASTDLYDHFNFTTMWPFYENVSHDKNRKMLWEGYAKTIWSDFHEIVEQILLFAELEMWCKYNNAELIIIPGFDNRYTKDYFASVIQKIISDRPVNEILIQKMYLMIDSVPWEKFIQVDGCNTFIDFIQNRIVGHIDRTRWNYWEYYGKGSSDRLLTKCCHPSAKSHDLFAYGLYQKLKELELV